MNDTDFAVMLKTYAGDATLAEKLISSFFAHRQDETQIFVVAPAQDLSLFHEKLHGYGSDLEFISEETFQGYLTQEPLNGLSPGYVNQQIVKLSFWETALARNYLCVDSDALFLRPFSADDFVSRQGIPYCVLSEDAYLKADPVYFARYWTGRDRSLARIYDLVGVGNQSLLSCHGNTVLSSDVLKSFKLDFLDPRGWSYLDVLREAPYEFGWYSAWLIATATDALPLHDPFFRVFHTEEEYASFLNRGHTFEDVARAYVGVIVNSNWSRNLQLEEQDVDRSDLLAKSIGTREMLRILGIKLRNRLKAVLP